MRLLGAEVRPVEKGTATLKDAMKRSAARLGPPWDDTFT